jgi:murein DD-endopeptidase MepM/ murein hydrolase activator NlpD
MIFNVTRVIGRALVVATGAVFLFNACQRQEVIPETEVLPETAPVHLSEKKIQSGEIYSSLVRNLDLEEEESQTLLESIRVNFPIRLFAGQDYRVRLQNDSTGFRWKSFSLLDRGGEMRHRLQRADSLIEYAYEAVPYEVDTVAVSGTLDYSLYEACLAVDEHPSLVDKVTKVFAWDIDFFRDPRKGDSFHILVEKRRDEQGRFRGYGEVLSARYDNAGTAFTGIRFRDGYYDAGGRSLEKLLLKAPLDFSRISSGFSRSRLHPVLGIRRPHWGVDYAGPTGTPIYAAGDGVVVYAKFVGGYGKTVKIRHNGVYNTYYAHLNGYASKLRAGQRVRQREVIGYLGSTGMSTGPHLDYRVEKNGQYMNPTSLKTEAKEGVSSAEWNDFTLARQQLLSRMLGSDSLRFAAQETPADSASTRSPG